MMRAFLTRATTVVCVAALAGCEGTGTATGTANLNVGFLQVNYQWQQTYLVKGSRPVSPNAQPTTMVPSLPPNAPAGTKPGEIWNTPNGPVIRHPDYPDREWPIIFPPATGVPGAVASPPMSAAYQFSYSPLSANIKLEFSSVPSGSFNYLRDWGASVTENSGAGTISVTSKDMQRFVSGLVAGGVYNYYVDDDNKLQLINVPFTDPSGNSVVVRYVVGVMVKNPVCIPITDIQ